MKILCGTDFSAESDRAMRAAAQLARRLGDTLHLVHAIAPISVPIDAGVSIGDMEDSLRRAARTLLEDHAIALRAAGATVETELLDGYPDLALAQRARQLDARLIVVGSHGRRAPARWILGSVAERLADVADRPVMVDCGGSEGLVAWALGRRPLEVMVGTDLSHATDAAIAWVRDLRRAGPVNVTLVHLYWPPDQYARLGLEGPRSFLSADPEVLNVIEREILERVGPLPGEGTLSVRVRPNWGSLGDALRMDAFYTGADLVLLTTHQRRGLGRLWHGSVAHAALHSASIPVLCVPIPGHVEAVTRSIPAVAHVLCATDLSPIGNAAIPFAYSIARSTAGVVELCHVFERAMPHPVYAYAMESAKLEPQHRAELEASLRALIPADAVAAGVTTRISILEGSHPAEAIDQAAMRLGVDAVCVGTHGRSGVGRAVLGSVAEALLRRSSRPVLMVPPSRD